jgi:hypothetical protein
MMTTLAKDRLHIALKINRLTLGLNRTEDQYQASDRWPADQARDFLKRGTG